MEENNNGTNIKVGAFPIQEQYDNLIGNLKVDLNNFLYSKMPPTMTLVEFEDLGIEIFKLINDEWEKRLNAGF